MNIARLVAAVFSGATMLGTASLFVSPSASSQVHGPSLSSSSRPGEVDNSAEMAALRTAKLAELTDWLDRLVGKFRFEGDVAEVIGVRAIGRQAEVIYSRSGVRGVGDCVSVGKGPGVQCMINVTWNPIMRWHRSQMVPGGPPAGAPATPGRAQFMKLDPAAILYGIDPDKLEIRYFQVNSRSIAAGGAGKLDGDTVTFALPCKIPDPELPGNCEQLIHVTAKPDRKRVMISIEVRDSVAKGPPFITFSFSMHRLTESGKQE